MHNSFFKQNISEKIWNDNYKWETDNKVEDTFRRVAKYVASLEKDSSYWEEKFYDILSQNKLVPGGRVLANAGTMLKETSMINCFVSSFKKNDCGVDSLKSIYEELSRQAQILKSEGGYGFCLNALRPRGSYINGVGISSPGAVEFLDLWDASSRVITSGSGIESKKGKKKARKGAMMVTLADCHPSIEEFVVVKRQPGKLEKFNMSVLITDRFMKAVKNNEKWDLIFPDVKFEKYDAEWDGNFTDWVSKGYPVVVHKTYDNAGELWDLIMKSTYNYAEPGVIFIDRVNSLNNLYYCEIIDATNPCVAGGTYVQTPNGVVKVEDVKVGDIVSTLHPKGYEPVKEIEVHKKEKVFKVSFSDGGYQIVTPAHIYHTVPKNKCTKFVDKKRLDQLSVGDSVIVNPVIIEGRLDIDSIEYKKALFCGILLGDGYYTEKVLDIQNNLKIATNQDDEEYNNNIISLIDDLGYEVSTIDTNKRSKTMSIVLKNGREIISDLKLLPKYSYEKEIPDFYLNDVNKIAGVINGLLATDGNVNLKSNHPQVRFCTSSYNMALQIKRLLSCLGCHAFLISRNDKGGIIDGREIIRKHENYNIIVSGSSLKNLSKFICNNIHSDKKDKIKFLMYNSNLSGNYLKTAITNIEEYGYAKVYDLYCEESDTWITDGYVQQGCGEQPLSAYGSCNLSTVNLVSYYNNGNFDFKSFKDDLKTILRFQDNIIDLTNYPLPEIKEKALVTRRVGTGIMGLGSLFYLLNIKYGNNKQCIDFVNKLMSTMANTLYQESAILSKEKGCFTYFDRDKYLSSNFIERLDSDTIALINEHGMRNSHLLTVAPNGNTGIFSNNVSGGIEPVFNKSFIRTVTLDVYPKNLPKPNNINWVEKTYEGCNDWKFVKEGRDNLLTTDFEGVKYKIDENRGLTYEEFVCDYAVNELGLDSVEEDWAVTTQSLGVDDHLSVFNSIAYWVDSAVSKTINIPYDYPFEEFKNVYMDAYNTGNIKGCTTYRDGTLKTVLKSSESKKIEAKDVNRKSPKRPKDLKADIHRISVKGEKWVVFVGLLDEKPYEVFAGKFSDVETLNGYDSCVIRKKAKGVYSVIIGDSVIVDNLAIVFKNETYEAITRLISMTLRHGVSDDIQWIIEQLNKAPSSIVDFEKSIGRALKKYIKEGIDSNETCPECGLQLVYKEGCKGCINGCVVKCGG